MIRTIATPVNTDVHISIPDEYIGRKLEIIIFATDEAERMKPERHSTLADLKGLFTKDEAIAWGEEMNNIRHEWDRNI